MGGPFWQAIYSEICMFNVVHVSNGQMDYYVTHTHSKYNVSGWHSSVIEVQVPTTAKRILHES